jgi:hypothetical protein
MWRLVFANTALMMLARADAFTFVIGGSVASQQYQFKAAAFVFRTEGCDSRTPEVTATAEGVVYGERKTIVLKISQASKPGIYAIFPTLPQQGHWLVNLKGVCGNLNAGAIVPVGSKGFIRESSKFFPRSATDREIETSLKALAPGGTK